MRPFRLITFLLALTTACGAPPVPMEPDVALPDAGLVRETRYVALIARVVTPNLGRTVVVARLDAGVVAADLAYDLALEPDLPRSLMVDLGSEVYRGASPGGPWTASWREVVTQGLTGSLLKSTFLQLEASDAGTHRLEVRGEVSDSSSRWPLVTTVTVRARPVEGYRFTSFNQRWSRGCEDSVRIATGAYAMMPTVQPVFAGEAFTVSNAPRPVAFELESSERVEVQDSGFGFRVHAPATVMLRARTERPVDGLERLEVVGPSAVTSIETKFQLLRAAAKGGVLTAIEPGTSYPLFRPDEENVVRLDASEVMTADGPLCSEVPASWFEFSTETPAVCVPREQVVRILGAGECRLSATLRGTSFRWDTRFTTTR
jgi:hypothetical protein